MEKIKEINTYNTLKLDQPDAALTLLRDYTAVEAAGVATLSDEEEKMITNSAHLADEWDELSVEMKTIDSESLEMTSRFKIALRGSDFNTALKLREEIKKLEQSKTNAIKNVETFRSRLQIVQAENRMVVAEELKNITNCNEYINWLKAKKR